MKKLFALFAVLLSAVLSGEEFVLYYPFEDSSSQIRDVKGSYPGLYTPCDDRDNDTPETTDPNRYHKAGIRGKGLFFFSLLKSYASVQVPLPETETLYLRVWLSPATPSRAYIAGNLTDTGKRGFSLQLNGNEWRMYAADGTKRASFQCPCKLPVKHWSMVEFRFDKGNWSLSENGKKMGSGTVEVKKLAKSENRLFLGNYPGRKDAYPYSGGMDEFVAASSEKLAPPNLAVNNVPLPNVSALAEPAEGYEHFNGGVKTINLFREYPFPATFVFFVTWPCQPVLKLTTPKGVSVREFRFDKQLYAPKGETLKDGRTVYALPLSGRQGAKGTTGRRKAYVLFDAEDDFNGGQVTWAALDGKSVRCEDSFRLKVLAAPQSLPDGKFSFMSWLSDDLYFSLDSLRQIAKLHQRSGLTHKGLFSPSDPAMLKADAMLKKEFGFTLYSVHFWDGPTRYRFLKGLTPEAVDSNGKPCKVYCPRQLVRNPKARDRYLQHVREGLHPELVSVAMMDYEPWSVRYCFCEACRKEFSEKFRTGKVLTSQEILKDHRQDWAFFWTDTCEMWVKMMADTFRTVGPKVQVWDYTYDFPYDNEAAMKKKFISIPKDVRKNERHYDVSMISLYHINGKEAFRQMELSAKYLKKPVIQASLISRANANTGHYTSPAECLSPQKIAQKAVLCGALGQTVFSIWPGTMIDGSVHLAMSEAARFVRTHERFYAGGKRDDSAVRVSVTPSNKDTAVLAHVKGDRRLVTLFNFGRKPVVFRIEGAEGVTVAPDGWAFRELTKK